MYEGIVIDQFFPFIFYLRVINEIKPYWSLPNKSDTLEFKPKAKLNNTQCGKKGR